MMKSPESEVKILHRHTRAVLYAGSGTLAEVLQKAATKKANLRYADLERREPAIREPAIREPESARTCDTRTCIAWI